MRLIHCILSEFKPYRWLIGGNWKYVVCKPAPWLSCWISTKMKEEALTFEFVEKEENYK